ncbi:MAG: type II secretion system F family protein [Planctomycetes bacterium]|nr:type II secretion system F family protein [Planctomycetota bacterium]
MSASLSPALVAAFDPLSLTPFAVFLAVGAIAWLVLDVVTREKPRAEQRLDEFSGPARRRGQEAGRTGDTMTRVLEKATPALAKPLQSKNVAEATKLRNRLTQAGFRGESATTMFLGLKFAGLLAGLAAGGGIALLTTGFHQSSIYTCMVAAGLLFYLPDLAILFLGRKRKDAIFLGLPDALDLLVVCVEAGLGLDQALRKVSEEMKRTFPVICEEFGLSNLHLQMGRPRTEVLQDLGNRTGVDDLRALASILIQADKFGSSIAQALRVQSDSMRTRRKQIAEEKAAKTAVKLIFPLVIFIFPGIFVVLVGPAAITMMREMFPAMGANGG